MHAGDRQRPPPGALHLDHVAHFVPDLGAAARALETLGLRVTAESAHRDQNGPAGTSNRCVMLDEGYIEILAPTLQTENARRVRALMARYGGVHLCCFGTPDADAESRRLAAHGFAPEPTVRLARTLPDGTPLRFNVVYVPAEKMPEGRIQYVEQLTPRELWRAELVNAGLRLEAMFVVADDPAAAAARWARYAGLLPRPADGCVELALARGRVIVGTRAALAARLGEAPPAPALAGYALRCTHAADFAARCGASGFAVHREASSFRVKLPPSLGGVWVIS
jgi:glyoxalase-like protein